MFDRIHAIELDWIRALQSIRSPILDHVMQVLDSVDTAFFWFGLTLCLLFFYNQKQGVRMLFLLVLSGFINQNLKTLFGEPRPLHLDPSLGLVHLKSFGFPSGAAQTIVILLGFLVVTLKKQWFSWLALFFILLVSFSRVYLGAHFPTDVLGGWIVGTILLFSYLYALPFIERFIAKNSKRTLCIASVLVFIVFMLLGMTPSCTTIAIFGLFLSLGLIWAPPLDTLISWSRKTLRCVVALCGAIPLILLQPHLHDRMIFSILYEMICGLWVGYGMFYCSKKLESWLKVPK